MARARRRIGCRRKNWRRAARRRLEAKAGTLAVEGLNVTGMTRSAKGTVEEPGTNVARKSGTGRVILDTGSAAPERIQGCKAANAIVLPARNPPRTCHACGMVEAAGRGTTSRDRNAGPSDMERFVIGGRAMANR